MLVLWRIVKFYADSKVQIINSRHVKELAEALVVLEEISSNTHLFDEKINIYNTSFGLSISCANSLDFDFNGYNYTISYKNKLHQKVVKEIGALIKSLNMHNTEFSIERAQNTIYHIQFSDKPNIVYLKKQIPDALFWIFRNMFLYFLF